MLGVGKGVEYKNPLGRICEADSGYSTGTNTMTWQGKTYATVDIGGRTWMAENYAYLPSINQLSDLPDTFLLFEGTPPMYFVYDYAGTSVTDAKNHANYAAKGVLYNHAAIQEACFAPPGWHVPSSEECHDLIVAAGGSELIASEGISEEAWNMVQGVRAAADGAISGTNVIASVITQTSSFPPYSVLTIEVGDQLIMDEIADGTVVTVTAINPDADAGTKDFTISHSVSADDGAFIYFRRETSAPAVALRSTSGWINNTNGDNSSGMNFKPSGRISKQGSSIDFRWGEPTMSANAVRADLWNSENNALYMSQGKSGEVYADWIASDTGQIGVGYQLQNGSAFAVRFIKDL